MLNSSTYNHLTVCKQMINIKIKLATNYLFRNNTYKKGFGFK